MKGVQFEWDTNKELTNVRKHGKVRIKWRLCCS